MAHTTPKLNKNLTFTGVFIEEDRVSPSNPLDRSSPKGRKVQPTKQTKTFSLQGPIVQPNFLIYDLGNDSNEVPFPIKKGGGSPMNQMMVWQQEIKSFKEGKSTQIKPSKLAFEEFLWKEEQERGLCYEPTLSPL